MKILFTIIIAAVFLSIIQPSKVYAERVMSNKEKNALKSRPSLLEGQDTLFDEVKSLTGMETDKDIRKKAATEKLASEKAAAEKLALEKAATEKLVTKKLVVEQVGKENPVLIKKVIIHTPQ